MSRQKLFEFYNIGNLQGKIGDKHYAIAVDICYHGVRFTTSAVLRTEIGDQYIEKTKKIYFGEGEWLALPSIEEAVVELLDGDIDDAERLSNKYDELLSAAMPELITDNRFKGFICKERERLKADCDI